MRQAALRLAVAAGGVVAGGALSLLLLPGSVGREVHASSRADREAGRALFHEKGCEQCHGADLEGGEKGPNLTGVGRQLKPDGIRHQIVAGGGGMPAFGDVLAPDEVSRLVDFLASQKKKVRAQKPGPATAAPKLPANGSDDQS